MKKLRTILIFIFLVIEGLYTLYNLFFAEFYCKYATFKDWEKDNLGGIVINKTSHNIKITDNTRVLVVPPQKTSRNIKLFDADSIVIENPTIFNGNNYTYGVVKICDISSAKVISENGTDKIKESFASFFCQFIDKSGWYPSTKEAFIQNGK